MGPHARSPRIEELLAHADWVRQVARDLVRDEQRADDVVQETWVAALESPPSDARNLRAWLTTVARNVARSLGRSEKRRTAREEAAARVEALESTAEVAGRAALQRDLVDRVLSLDEPYRAVLLLRYFEELEPAEIAKRLAIPVATVRTRHARGLEKLRAKLERDYGDRRAWTLALAPLAAGEASNTAPIWTGGALLTTSTKIAVVAALAVCASVLWWKSPAGTGRGERVPAGGIEAGRTSAPEVASLPSGEDRVALASEVEDRPSTDAAAPIVGSVDVRVVDYAGRPFPGVELEEVPFRLPFGSPEQHENAAESAGSGSREEVRESVRVLEEKIAALPTWTSGGDGKATLPGDVDLAKLRVWQRGRVLIGGGWRRLASGAEELVLVAAPTASLAGRTVDAEGAPVAGAQVRATTSIGAMETLPWTLQRMFDREDDQSMTSSERGEFAFVSVPKIPQLAIEASKGDRYSRMVSPFAGQTEPAVLELVLAPDRKNDAYELALSGRVVDARGAAVASAPVFLGHVSAESAADGSFRLVLGQAADEISAVRSWTHLSKAEDLVAVRPGVQAAILEGFSRKLADPSARDGIVLQLGPPALSISGRVVDARGAGIPGLELHLLDPAYLGRSSRTVEDLSRVTREQGLAKRAIRTAEDGRFTIDGLSPRAYRLLAIGVQLRVVVESDPIEAGSADVELRAPADGVLEKVSGRVVTKSGVPLAGLEVVLELGWVTDFGLVLRTQAEKAITDLGGRVTLTRVPRRRACLSVYGTNVPSTTIDASEIVPGTDLEITVDALVRFQVETRPGDPATAFDVLDERSKPMMVVVLRKDGASHHQTRVPLRERSSGVCQVEDGARTLVLYEGDRELRRVPLDLSPDEVRIVTP